MPALAFLNARAAHDYVADEARRYARAEAYDALLAAFLRGLLANHGRDTVVVVRSDHGRQGGPARRKHAAQARAGGAGTRAHDGGAAERGRGAGHGVQPAPHVGGGRDGGGGRRHPVVRGSAACGGAAESDVRGGGRAAAVLSVFERTDGLGAVQRGRGGTDRSERRQHLTHGRYMSIERCESSVRVSVDVFTVVSIFRSSSLQKAYRLSLTVWEPVWSE